MTVTGKVQKFKMRETFDFPSLAWSRPARPRLPDAGHRRARARSPPARLC